MSGDIDITVVCNDQQMDEERTLADAMYGSSEELLFDVTVRNNLPMVELHALLESETQFLHYIGHIDEKGFKCADEMLDARELDWSASRRSSSTRVSPTTKEWHSSTRRPSAGSSL